MLLQRSGYCGNSAPGGYMQLRSTRPASCLPCNLMQRPRPLPQNNNPEPSTRSPVAAAAGEARRPPVMRDLNSSSIAPLAGTVAGNAPGYTGTVPGFADSQPITPVVVLPISQIPVAAGSRQIPVAPYVPKTVSLFGAQGRSNVARPRDIRIWCLHVCCLRGV